MKKLMVGICLTFLIVSTVQGQSAYETYAAPLEIQINGDPADGQVFTVGEQLTVTCRVVANAKAYLTDTSGTPEPNYKAQAQSSLRLVQGTSVPKRDDHDVSVEDATLAEVNVDKTLSVTYTVQIPSQWPGQYKIEAVSNAYAMYWDPTVQPDGAWQIADNEAESDALLFEVVDPQQDTTPPVITLNGPGTMTLECGVDSYTEHGATVTDDTDPAPSLVIGGDTVDTTTCGIYVVTYDATDSSGNTATQVTRTVTVQDTIGPAITCPQDLTVTVDPGETGSVVEYEVTATDDCGDPVTVACEPPSGSVFPLGATIVNCTATDSSSNQSTCTFTVTVEQKEVLAFFDEAVADGTLAHVRHFVGDF
jgi:hypothetical protein